MEGQGSWRDVLEMQDAQPSLAPIVVCRHTNEALWADVLNLGGFDLLEKPFVAEEVERVSGLQYQV